MSLSFFSLSHWTRTLQILPIPSLSTFPNLFHCMISPASGHMSYCSSFDFFQVFLSTFFFPSASYSSGANSYFYFPVLYKTGTFIHKVTFHAVLIWETGRKLGSGVEVSITLVFLENHIFPNIYREACPLWSYMSLCRGAE